MAVVFALLAALGYGASDFVAGVWARRLDVLTVSVIAQVAAVVLVALALAGTAHGWPAAPAAGWGAASGLGGALGTLALYRGFRRSRIGLVAPISALVATVLPAVTGLASGERLALPALAGIGVAVPAVWLVAATPGQVSHRAGNELAGVTHGALAGVGFATFFITLHRAGSGFGLWPVAIGQWGALALLVTVAWVAGRRRLPPGGPALLGSGLTGALGGAATVLYFLSTIRGTLAVAAVLTSLYPAGTVVLARLVLHEHLGRTQTAGLVLSALSIALIAGG